MLLQDYGASEAARELNAPICLFERDGHSVHWIGIDEDTAFRCNAYLVVDQDEALLIDPGSRANFPAVHKSVCDVLSIDRVAAIFVGHQDADVGASMVDWLELKPDLKIVSSPRSHVLLTYFGSESYDAVDVDEGDEYVFGSGRRIVFKGAPYLHSPAAVTAYDETARYLFSGDIWAALDIEWRLIVSDFEKHLGSLDAFHLDYMGSQIACQGFIRRIEGLQIDAILPQHGSIISKKDVPAALAYLDGLLCGTDLTYPDL